MQPPVADRKTPLHWDDGSGRIRGKQMDWDWSPHCWHRSVSSSQSGAGCLDPGCDLKKRTLHSDLPRSWVTAADSLGLLSDLRLLLKLNHSRLVHSFFSGSYLDTASTTLLPQVAYTGTRHGMSPRVLEAYITLAWQTVPALTHITCLFQHIKSPINLQILQLYD